RSAGLGPGIRPTGDLAPDRPRPPLRGASGGGLVAAGGEAGAGPEKPSARAIRPLRPPPPDAAAQRRAGVEGAGAAGAGATGAGVARITTSVRRRSGSGCPVGVTAPDSPTASTAKVGRGRPAAASASA